MADAPWPAPLAIGLTSGDIDTLALALCATRGEHPEGSTWGDPRHPGGVTFLELARRDVAGVLEALASLPPRRAQGGPADG